jgi:alpha-galactosidase
MDLKKIAIVGAGARFTPGLLADVIGRPGLEEVSVALFDPDPARPPVLERWGQRLARSRRVPARVEAVPTLEAALRGSDVVFTTLRVGGREAYHADLAVPARYGIEQGVADSVGPGGFFAALRQIPAFAGVARTMERACPDAWLLNLSNPMTVICRTVARVSRIRCVGLCHGIYGRHQWLARYLGVPREALGINHAGVNHLTWVTELTYQGKDAYPLLAQRFREVGHGGEPISFQLLELFGQFPSPADRHVAEFYPYYHRPDAGGGRAYGLETSAEQIARDARRRADYWATLAREADALVPLSRRYPGEGEGAVDLVAALSGRRAGAGAPRPFAVNLPNTGGIVSGLPEDGIVEVFATVEEGGLRPRPPGTLSPGVAAGLRARLDQQALTVEAGLTGDRRLAHQALLADPLVRTVEQARGLLEELLARHAPYLPQFA